MSQYISSFLIDPVFRQARRFSRPGEDSPHTASRPSLLSNGDATQHNILAEAATVSHEEFPPLNLNDDDSPASITFGNQEPQVSGVLHSGSNRLQTLENEHPDTDPNLQRVVETDVLEPELNAREYAIVNSDSTAHRPLRGVHDGLRSNTSSFSNSARSIMDAAMSSADRSGSTSSAQDARGRGDSTSSRSVEGALPADDGMSHMRKRIIAIQRTDSSNEVKARLVHEVMTEKHNSSQQSLLAPRAQSPGSLQSSEQPFTPSSPKSVHSLRQAGSPPTSSSSNGTTTTSPFLLTAEDLKPTYYKSPQQLLKDRDQDDVSNEGEEDHKALGCEHYKRNIKLQCSACHRWYTCRFCHDAVEDHMLNRRATENMLCMLCGCAQAASEECALCSERAAWYYCDVCKLWDDSPDKSIYHCNECGICRVGKGLGKDFFHCKVSRF